MTGRTVVGRFDDGRHPCRVQKNATTVGAAEHDPVACGEKESAVDFGSGPTEEPYGVETTAAGRPDVVDPRRVDGRVEVRKHRAVKRARAARVRRGPATSEDPCAPHDAQEQRDAGADHGETASEKLRHDVHPLEDGTSRFFDHAPSVFRKA